eukprot:5585110-Pyramimonas_sp.AAC.5
MPIFRSSAAAEPVTEQIRLVSARVRAWFMPFSRTLLDPLRRGDTMFIGNVEEAIKIKTSWIEVVVAIGLACWNAATIHSVCVTT